MAYLNITNKLLSTAQIADSLFIFDISSPHQPIRAALPLVTSADYC